MYSFLHCSAQLPGGPALPAHVALQVPRQPHARQESMGGSRHLCCRESWCESSTPWVWFSLLILSPAACRGCPCVAAAGGPCPLHVRQEAVGCWVSPSASVWGLLCASSVTPRAAWLQGPAGRELCQHLSPGRGGFPNQMLQENNIPQTRRCQSCLPAL